MHKPYRPKLNCRMKRYLSISILTSLCFTWCLAAEEPKDIITSGKGLTKIELGDSKEKLFKAFGKPTDKLVMDPKDKDRFPGDYWVTFGRSGVQALMENDRILTLFFHYKSKKNSIFNGVTEKGIGFSSSVRDVISSYGKPGETRKSVVSKFGEHPGAQEIRLNYDALGVSFLFLDGELSQVIVTKIK